MSFGARALSALALVASVLAGAASAQSSRRSLTGWLVVLWRDARPGTWTASDHAFAIIDDRGRWTSVDIDEAIVAAAGGLRAIDRTRVTIEGDALAPGGVPRFRASAVRVVPRAPGLTTSFRTVGPVSGSQPYLTILCRFVDTPFSDLPSRQKAQVIMGSGYPGMDDFWRENSNGMIDLQGSQVAGWYDLPHPRAYYVTSSGANLGALADDCTHAADPDVYFPAFRGVNLQFSDALDCCSWGGAWMLDRDGEYTGYAMTWMGSWALSSAAYAHEMGHSFGFPHSHGPYGKTYDSRWDVMSYTFDWTDPTWGSIGPNTIAFHKNLAGWIPASRRLVATAPESTFLLERSAQPQGGTAMLLAEVPIVGSAERYTVEARRFVGSYDAHVPAEAVIIHRVLDQATVVDVDHNGNVNDAGAEWETGETFVDTVGRVMVSIGAQVGDAWRVTIRNGSRRSIMAAVPAGHRDSIVAGVSMRGTDSARVYLLGPGSTTPVWTATHHAPWLALVNATGRGNSVLQWRHAPAGLAVGTYVDTIVVTASGAVGSPFRIVDTLRVLSPNTLLIAASPASRRDTASAWSTTAHADSAAIGITGPNASTVVWSASRRRPSTVLVTRSGTGDGRLRWRRDPSLLSAGLYVDTITVTARGAVSARVIDTLAVMPSTSAPRMLVMMIDTRACRDSAIAHSPFGTADSVLLTLAGPGADSARWTVTHRRSWNAMPSTSGVGSGWVRWMRSTAALPTGLAVDTITVTVAGAVGSPVRIVDSLHVMPTPSVDDAARDLLGAQTLTSLQRTYLDALGDHNGTYDLGDFLAFADGAPLKSRNARRIAAGAQP